MEARSLPFQAIGAQLWALGRPLVGLVGAGMVAGAHGLELLPEVALEISLEGMMPHELVDDVVLQGSRQWSAQGTPSGEGMGRLSDRAPVREPQAMLDGRLQCLIVVRPALA